MPRPRTVRRRRLSAAALAVAALTALPAASATAAPAAPRTSAPHATANSLDIAMQAQENSNWCWAGSGNTIAAWYGRGYSQNQFCNAAFQRPQNTDCPNDQATLGNVQNAFDWMGLNPGSYVSGYLTYATVRGEIDARRPVETRIQWPPAAATCMSSTGTTPIAAGCAGAIPGRPTIATTGAITATTSTETTSPGPTPSTG